MQTFSQRLTIGPKLGINVSTLSNAEGAESRVGLTGGGFLVYSIVKNFGVSADVLYSQQGAKSSEGGVTLDYKLDYLSIPILANVFFGELGDQLRPKIVLGPSLNFLLSSDPVDKSELNSFDLSAIIGAGLNYRIGDRTWLNMDARYGIGATEIDKSPQPEDDAVKNNVFSVTLGVGFGFGEE
jgi:hypothetical protein